MNLENTHWYIEIIITTYEYFEFQDGVQKYDFK